MIRRLNNFATACLLVGLLGLSACASNSCWRQIGTDHPGACQ